MELSSSKIKKFFYFWKWNFRASCFSYISGGNFLSSKKKQPLWKNFLYLGKLNYLSPSLKNFLYFRRIFQSLKNKQKICSKEISCLLRRFSNLYSSKAWGIFPGKFPEQQQYNLRDITIFNVM